MKIKITDRTEIMMAQAVALSQNGMMKSTIHAKGKDLFILNMDDTILIQFQMDQEFPQAISFFANDYESNNLILEDGKLSFMTHSSGYERKKTCPVPKINFNDVLEISNKFALPDKSIAISFNKDMLPLLNDELSHIEFSGKNGLKIVQKNIYSGAKIEVEDITAKEGILGNTIPDFETIGIRTVDFKALFQLADQLTFYIQKGHNWISFSDSFNLFSGVLSTCIYDEIGYVAEVK